ncbi:hypothetical protein GCM10009751_37090 [Myceligenerans crystallogenes]|uniref:TadE-like domain-containing protein n=2 Tax=Myceligenerans crystallogenes TaxID=316335 RepID=A0ABN2NLZ1_9MICO
MPVVFGLIFLGVQAGLVFHARQVALAAANQGVVAASVEEGTAEAGHAAADDFLGQVGGAVLRSWNVTATRDADRSAVTVQARPYAILADLVPEVSATAQMPTETVRGAP